ncbi:histidinol dehydrogenase [Oceanobacillus halotolerans]|uniref:histidinol dehydrogenase n=1 Tax=Oceanobacillus halotolerans TaxID=2663380 RepID=UPI0013DA0C23|nr:histidinol dehydrogenase [Oceanobacillus halotolerans]
MKIITGKQFTQEKRKLTAASLEQKDVDQAVLQIISQVREEGDQALFQLTEKFDQVKLNALKVTDEEFYDAKKKVSTDFLQALTKAKENITNYHKAQKEKSWFTSEAAGITLGQKITPLDHVGIYVPGGKAAYPSTVLMNVLPAKIAGVEQVAMTTPPQPDGTINPHVLVAAAEAGVDVVYKLGGAQAIAALTYGTETISPVAKITGPGNIFVARAKKWVYGDIDIDMIAGPSEICVVADGSAPPAYVAADLLSQAEHDELAKPICITTSEELAESIQKEIAEQTITLERKAIIEKSVQNHGVIIVVNNLLEAFDIVNEVAPEHLQLMIENPFEHISYVRHAGAIFLGNYSPEPLGDYFAGPNHTLPTSGTAQFSSPLGVYDFMKKSSIIQYSKAALLDAAEAIQTLANTEGLTAHANSIQVRKEDDKNA